ncbi:UNVERIFIED_CONTAM: Transcription factor UNE10 [Sesamum calycinum]|uniref:Transcription factor UNE10 n=1 Tax=Sesamum calycinum TaxID=2727403 RepID=A0AAW2SZW6_9LAMI
MSFDTCEREPRGGGFTCPAFLVTPEKTILGKDIKASGNAHDSRESGDEEAKKKGNNKSSISTKRSRAAGVYNQSERTDKASMLDEIIEYLRQLQAQVQMMERMNMSSMMFATSHATSALDVYDASHGNGHGDGRSNGNERYKPSGRNAACYSTHQPFHAPALRGSFAGGFSILRPFIGFFLHANPNQWAWMLIAGWQLYINKMQQPPAGSVGSDSDSCSGSGSGPKI